jgi:hypothetical protein
MVNGVPAKCLVCKFEFAAPGIFGGGGGGSLTLSGGGTNCPRCGGFAAFGSGRYTLVGNHLDFQSGPPATAELISRLRGIATRARDKVKTGTADAEQILAEVAQVSPDLAKKLRAKHALPTFVLILLLIWLVKSFELSIKVDLNHLLDQAYHVWQGDDPAAHLDDPPPKPPAAPAPSNKGPEPLPELAPATVAIHAILPNRQARRRRQAQARKRPARRL